MKRPAIYVALAFLLVAGYLAYNRVPRVEQPSPQRTPSVTLVGKNIPLHGGTANAIRIAISPDDPSLRAIATLAGDSTRAVWICPIATMDAAVPPLERCKAASSGVQETVTGIDEAVAIVLPEGTATLDLKLEYAERDRAVRIRVPSLRAPLGAACGDNACNPIFEMTPSRAGAFTAEVRWDGEKARVSLLQGRVLARSFTATGIPYSVAATEEGPSPLRIRADLGAPGEYALVFPVTGSGELSDVEIVARWPS